jgi:hypothetical protein
MYFKAEDPTLGHVSIQFNSEVGRFRDGEGGVHKMFRDLTGGFAQGLDF